VKVILLQTIKGLGNKFEVKQVKDGYGRNFLLPRGLAKIAANETIKELEAQKAAWQKREQETKNKLEALAKEISDREFKFTLKTGEKGEIFGSITKEAIAAEINKTLFPQSGIEPRNIDLGRPIKTPGEHRVEVSLGKEMKTLIKIIAEPSQS